MRRKPRCPPSAVSLQPYSLHATSGYLLAARFDPACLPGFFERTVRNGLVTFIVCSDALVKIVLYLEDCRGPVRS